MKMFCSEQLKITCNFTAFNKIAQNKNEINFKRSLIFEQ